MLHVHTNSLKLCGLNTFLQQCAEGQFINIDSLSMICILSKNYFPIGSLLLEKNNLKPKKKKHTKKQTIKSQIVQGDNTKTSIVFIDRVT